jgi:hypothetical protein
VRQFLFALAALLAVCPRSAIAIEPGRRDVIVVTGRVWDGDGYKEMFLPSHAPSLMLLGGRESALKFVRTQEYYWPLSRQVYVDFEARKDGVDGVLRVWRDGQVIADIDKSVYSIVYPKGAINGDARLLWGSEAEGAYAEYESGEREFARRFVEAQRANSEYERALLAAGEARNRGEPVAPVGAPPPLPEPSLRLVTKPEPGYRLALDPGSYEIALMSGESETPKTRRELRVIDAERRRSIVADIIPEERWTRPLASNSTDARVFARPGATFYLTLADADKFDESEYLPITAPQAEPVLGRTLWVRRHASNLDRVSVEWTGRAAETLARSRFKAEQTGGSSFGYLVRPAGPSEKEDLNAFAISAPSDPTIERGVIYGADARFAREVVIVRERDTPLALLLCLAPMAAWGIVKSTRAGLRIRRT